MPFDEEYGGLQESTSLHKNRLTGNDIRRSRKTRRVHVETLTMTTSALWLESLTTITRGSIPTSRARNVTDREWQHTKERWSQLFCPSRTSRDPQPTICELLSKRRLNLSSPEKPKAT